MQFEWNSKDSVSFVLYKEVIESKEAQFLIWLESNNREVNLVDLRNGSTEYRFNNFVIKENNESNTITFLPNIAGCPAYFRIKTTKSINMSIIRKDGTAGDTSTFQPGEIKLELNPAGMRKYIVNVDEKNSSEQEHVDEEAIEQEASQEDSVPEFFGGSFYSSSEQSSDSSTSEPVSTVNSPIDDAFIFTGGFSSESESGTVPETNTTSSAPSTAQQSVGGTSSNTMPFFADMFPPTGAKRETPNSSESERALHQERYKEQPEKQDTGFSSPPSGFPQEELTYSRTPSSGSASGFSVPYVETEGIRERRENVHDLQHNNDRTAQEVEVLEKKIADLENRSRHLSESKSSLISRLEVLQREYDKDYSKFKTDIEEIKSRYTVDQSILEFYKDKDLVPIEDLLKQTEALVYRVEEQIRLFVTAQQKKSDEIEKALKVGKKE